MLVPHPKVAVVSASFLEEPFPNPRYQKAWRAESLLEYSVAQQKLRGSLPSDENRFRVSEYILPKESVARKYVWTPKMRDVSKRRHVLAPHHPAWGKDRTCSKDHPKARPWPHRETAASGRQVRVAIISPLCHLRNAGHSSPDPRDFPRTTT